MCGMILRSPDFDPLSNCIESVKNSCVFRTVSMVTDVSLCTLWNATLFLSCAFVIALIEPKFAVNVYFDLYFYICEKILFYIHF